MKVGILTFHRACNYGAVLQCYALQETLKSMGHEVYIVDYRQPYIEEVYAVLNIKEIIKKISTPINLLRYFKHSIRRYRRKRHFSCINTLYHIDAKYKSTIQANLDAYIIGSDQLWSLYCLDGEKDDVYLGEFKHDSNAKIIGYAISTNHHSLETLKEEGLNKYLKNFSALSMREKFAAEFIGNNFHVNADVCIDPTLLLNPKDWERLVDSKWENEDYVLLYQLRHPKGKNYNLLREKSEDLARQIGGRVIEITDSVHSVSDFVSLFKYAKYVVTTSFHGTVFSVIFNTPFYSVRLQDGHDERYVNLLSAIGLDSCCVDINFLPNANPVVFNSTHDRILDIKKESLSFLEKALSE